MAVTTAALVAGCGDADSTQVGTRDEAETPAASSDAPEPRDPAASSGEVAPECEDLRDDPQPPLGHDLTSIDPSPQEVREWVRDEHKHGYAGAWFDQAADAVTVAFAEQFETRQDEVRERFGDGVRIVPAEHSRVLLDMVDDRVGEEVAAQYAEEMADPDPTEAEAGRLHGAMVSEQLNRVVIGLFAGDDEVLAELTQRYGADRICLEVFDPDEPIARDAPVVPLAKADRWRDGLRPEDLDHPFGVIEIAFDRETAERAWSDNVPADLPQGDGAPIEPGRWGSLDEVDFGTQAVVVWSSGESGSCRGWLTGIDTADGKVWVETDGGAMVCTDDYNQYRMVLAVDRDRLPDPGDLPTDRVEGIPTGLVRGY